jgi:hypothetical protein
MQMEKAVRAMPMSKEVPKKLETLATAKDYSYTSGDIEKMLEEKKKVYIRCFSSFLLVLVTPFHSREYFLFQ